MIPHLSTGIYSGHREHGDLSTNTQVALYPGSIYLAFSGLSPNEGFGLLYCNTSSNQDWDCMRIITLAKPVFLTSKKLFRRECSGTLGHWIKKGRDSYRTQCTAHSTRSASSS